MKYNKPNALIICAGLSLRCTPLKATAAAEAVLLPDEGYIIRKPRRRKIAWIITFKNAYLPALHRAQAIPKVGVFKSMDQDTRIKKYMYLFRLQPLDELENDTQLTSDKQYF